MNFLSFANSISKNIGKNISKNVGGNPKPTWSCLIKLKNTWNTWWFDWNEIIDYKSPKVSKISSHNSTETVENETGNIGFDREIPKKYIYLQRKYRTLTMI